MHFVQNIQNLKRWTPNLDETKQIAYKINDKISKYEWHVSSNYYICHFNTTWTYTHTHKIEEEEERLINESTSTSQFKQKCTQQESERENLEKLTSKISRAWNQFLLLFSVLLARSHSVFMNQNIQIYHMHTHLWIERCVIVTETYLYIENFELEWTPISS